MRNFRIYNPGEYDNLPVQHGLYDIGVRLKFETFAGKIRSRLVIPVQYQSA